MTTRPHRPDTGPATAARGYLALGDSYTIGEGVAADATWPWQLARALAEFLGGDTPVPVATTGWTSDELLQALAGDDGRRARAAAPFALVTLLIGVNDQYRDHELAAHLAGFERLLDAGIGFAGGDQRRLLVVSIPDWSISAFAGDDRGWHLLAVLARIERLAERYVAIATPASSAPPASASCAYDRRSA